MILLTHIIIALSSVVFTSYVFFVPSKLKLQVSYVLVALTLVTGTVLTVSAPAHMVQACISGIVYVSIVSVVIIAARNKLARLTA